MEWLVKHKIGITDIVCKAQRTDSACKIGESNYNGDFLGTGIFIGCSDADFHIPLQLLHESEVADAEMGANVGKRIYYGRDHPINEDELHKVRSMIQS